VLLFIILAGLVAFLNSLCRSIADFVREAQNQKIIDHVSDVIHVKSVAVDLEYYENPTYHDTLHRAQQEAAFRPISILNGLMRLGQNTITFLALAGLLVSFHWLVALILIIATLPGIVMRLSHGNQLYDWQRQRTATERRSHYFHWVLTDNGHAKEIRLFGLGELFKEWFRGLRAQLFTELFKIARRRSLSELIAQGSAIAAIFGTLAYIAYQTVYGVITLGGMVMYYQAFQRAQGALQEMLGSLSGLYEDNLFLSDFTAFLKLQPKVAEPRHPVPFPRPFQKGIVFEGVNFRYPSGHGPALENISLHIPPGKMVAFVGENGSGKTTLIKLLCRLYDPTSGSISIDGIDIRQLTTKSLRREVSVIFQDHVHYCLTARQNIWLGDITLDQEGGSVIAAARQTRADELIQRLPRGCDTVLGHWFEEEGELSIGELQRVALARNFLRRGQVIILDEPTSWMDARAEYEVFQSLRKMPNGRTAVLISHRFSTVRLADLIHVLERGRIIENGTHQELLDLGGRYAQLFSLQAGAYR
jgi:ATP-binding cassette subfamily B protein